MHQQSWDTANNTYKSKHVKQTCEANMMTIIVSMHDNTTDQTGHDDNNCTDLTGMMTIIAQT